jgi:hypothetical protein
MGQKIDTHNKKIVFGKHRGELFTRIPLGYLKWMVNQNAQQADIASAELERRGTPEPTIEISAHAIDRASLRIRRTWHKHRRDNEGLYTWLAKAAEFAIDNAGGIEAVAENDGKAEVGDVVFIFGTEGKWPVLKTVRRRMDKGDNDERA